MSEVPPPAPPLVAHQPRSGFTAAGPRIDRLAYAALTTGALSLVLSFFLIGPPALLLGPGAAIMGFISRRRIANSNGTLGGDRIALAGLIVGIIGFVVNAVWLVLVILIFGPTLSERSRA